MDVDQTKILFLFFSFFFPSFLFPRRIYFHLPPGGPGGRGGQVAAKHGVAERGLGSLGPDARQPAPSEPAEHYLAIDRYIYRSKGRRCSAGSARLPSSRAEPRRAPARRPVHGHVHRKTPPAPKNQLFPRVRLFEKSHHGRAHRSPMRSSVVVFLEKSRPREKLIF